MANVDLIGERREMRYFYFIGQVYQVVDDKNGTVFLFNILGTNHAGLRFAGAGQMIKGPMMHGVVESDLRQVGATFYVEVEEEVETEDGVVKHQTSRVVTEHGQFTQ